MSVSLKINSFLLITFIFFGCGMEIKKIESFDLYTNRFLDEYFSFNPEEAVKAGKHEFDGRLPDLSRENIKDKIKWLHNKRDSAAAYNDSSLTNNQKFLKSYFLAVVDGNIFWLEKAETPFKNPSFYTNIINPDVYITRNYAPLQVRIKSYSKFAENVPAVVDAMIKNMQLPLPPTFSELGKNAFTGYVEYFKNDIPLVFFPVKNSLLQSKFNNANGKAIAALQKAAEWFKEQQKHPGGNFMLGKILFTDMLRETERIDVSLDSLLQIGEADLNRNLLALKDACNKFAPGKPVKDCILMMQRNKPAQGPVKEARDQLNDLKLFIKTKKIVSIPSGRHINVEEAPPYARWNSAYMNNPGPYETSMPSVYYIAPPDPSWSKKEQEEYIPGEDDLLFTSVHEVWPGHFLQYLHTLKSSTKFQQVFWDYAFGEGWAHYTEEMMWNEGLGNGDPEVHIGQLYNALLRNVRYISSIKLHTGEITVEESEKMFKEKAFQDPGNARQQAARGTFDPAYLNYTLGKLMILKLRHDWMKLHGSNLKAFHDRLLSFGTPPIPLLRKIMLGDNDDGVLIQ